MARTRVFIASSLAGFIAGDDDDLSWLPGSGKSEGTNVAAPSAEPATPKANYGYDALFAQVGARLMGSRTYRVAEAFET